VVWGVRARITAAASAVVLTVLTLTGAGLVAGQRIVLVDSVDEGLQRYSDVIVAELDAETLENPIPGRGDEESFAEVVSPDGNLVASTAHTVTHADFASPEGNAPEFQSLPIDGQEYRVLTVNQGEMLVRTGTPLDDVNDSVQALTRGLALSIPLATLLLAALVWVGVGRALRPVEAIRSEVAEISGSSLDRRVPLRGPMDEVGRLAKTMNEMLDRLEDSAARQRRFVADASHELRTPLTRMRTEVDVGLSHPEPADLEATLRSFGDDLDDLERLVESLLVLAKSDGTRSAAPGAMVDLDDIVLWEVARIRNASDVPIDISGVSAAQVQGDSTAFASVVRNLIDNAVSHAGGRV
jgi:signal transduction histidine kinase